MLSTDTQLIWCKLKAPNLMLVSTMFPWRCWITLWENPKGTPPLQILEYHTAVDMINLKMPVPFISSYLFATG